MLEKELNGAVSGLLERAVGDRSGLAGGRRVGVLDPELVERPRLLQRTGLLPLNLMRLSHLIDLQFVAKTIADVLRRNHVPPGEIAELRAALLGARDYRDAA